jgi:hypothetical protein
MILESDQFCLKSIFTEALAKLVSAFIKYFLDLSPHYRQLITRLLIRSYAKNERSHTSAHREDASYCSTQKRYFDGLKMSEN